MILNRVYMYIQKKEKISARTWLFLFILYEKEINSHFWF